MKFKTQKANTSINIDSSLWDKFKIDCIKKKIKVGERLELLIKKDLKEGIK